MSFTIELANAKDLSEADLEVAAALTAAGFGRPADQHNYQDTKDHILSAEYLQLGRDNGSLVGFASYRRLLWQGGC